MTTRFFYNCGVNICAELEWVVDYLFLSGADESRDEIRDNLLSKREYMGWYECEVSNTIDELFYLYK